jgi:uncharacterized protein YjbI with pentapeptide repeats
MSADFENAHLNNADLRNAVLDSFFISDADLHNADLQGADLRGADLSETDNLTEAQILSAIIDENTKLPPQFKALKQKLLQAQKTKKQKKSQPKKR